MHVQRLAIGPERRHQHLEAEPAKQVDHIKHQPGFEVTGEGILHNHHRPGTLLLTQLRHCGRCGQWNAALAQLPLQIMYSRLPTR